MASQEQTFQSKYTNLLSKYQLAFPGVEPIAPEWWQLWLSKYSFHDIFEAIETLSHRSLNAQVTAQSTGKALSSLLRERALRRAFARQSSDPAVQS
jgi:hypothetical protein